MKFNLGMVNFENARMEIVKKNNLPKNCAVMIESKPVETKL